ncbi:unnamed protein product [Durusdinium trenchii]|uniref:Uncharacterized protein n=2 Tax=Durusdinium trenchii TaxID=1381693 RepID=A0ABP0KZH1_9DINO
MHMATVVLCGKVLRKGALPVAPHIRCITVWPQWPHDEETRSAKPVGDSKFRWPLNAPKDPEPGAVMTEDEVRALRKKIYHKIWQDMVWLDWSTWERRFWELKERAIPYDETAYTLLLHGYVLSHRHQSENAFLVLEEMKKAETHPALVRLNEHMLNSIFELQELGLRPERGLWQNVVRLCFHSSVRFQRKRQLRLKKELQALEPDDALALDAENIRQWLSGHDRLALPESGPERFRAIPGPELQRLPPWQDTKRLPARGRKSGRRRRKEVEESSDDEL